MTDTDAPRIHPLLARALERDGLTLTRLADLVGLDPRTVKRWGVDDDDSRAASFRRLEDWIAGRARAVEAEGGWAFEELGDGLPRADVDALVDELGRVLALASIVHQQLSGVVRPVLPEKSTADPQEALTGVNEGPYGMTMNPLQLRSVASDVRQRSKGNMVLFSQKVPPDFQARLGAAAARYGLSPADYLRALVELHTEPVAM